MILDVTINQSLAGIVQLSMFAIGGVAIIWRRKFNRCLNYLVTFNNRYKITSTSLILIGTALFLDAFATPAHAQFFQNAETWMTGQFTGADEAITLSFNVLRGLFILYLGISLVRVVQAARQDEDWQNLARTPMIILIAVTMGDILANLIIGSGGGAAGGGGGAGGG
ncbi:hypothetical protein DSM106972_094290 [Dulcicalothrix desertica PCC 7102]|uniref:Uncharacterized protein n=2 Tax=Dulcicalothrix desertica TaxID=32056 RepID=A0A3S1C2P9_9CYAN|nr:hypothetical protein DSM106972_094290 [Dulcicalothrix desertica PCC 7102]